MATRLAVVGPKGGLHADTLLRFRGCLGSDHRRPVATDRRVAPHIRRGANLCVTTAEAKNRNVPKGCAMCLGGPFMTQNQFLVFAIWPLKIICDQFVIFSFKISLIWGYVLALL